jgi:hypothetical protein
VTNSVRILSVFCRRLIPWNLEEGLSAALHTKLRILCDIHHCRRHFLLCGLLTDCTCSDAQHEMTSVSLDRVHVYIEAMFLLEELLRNAECFKISLTKVFRPLLFLVRTNILVQGSPATAR